MEGELQLWGAWMAFTFGSAALLGSYLAYRRHKHAGSLRMGVFIFAMGAVFLVATLLGWR